MAGALRRQISNSSGLMLFASVQFVVLTLLAMWVYPGGAKFDLASDHYLFFGNFFSDLGATHTYAGHRNFWSMALFVVAATVNGLALMRFGNAWRAVYARRRHARGAGQLSQASLVVSGVCFIGIAATPWDHLLSAHMNFVHAAFSLLLVYVVSLIVLQAQNRWPRRYIALNVLYLMVLAGYVLMLFMGPTLETAAGLGAQVVAQKIIVYSSVFNIGVQALGVRGHLTGL
ncbi:hypothetical protein [Arenimonas oryziterrae]|uniref:DUF998 domain-containing protein n=1 Tax=Arenimonas oryziterrae DSM 21050 = YC6267 TaxID=1121015 RepID=A0A091AMK3_9GAMM|nr:hypothetical protein [Arenimonas oryziterrae]KFN41423.1 hypothetical protein N789_05975 [Arenimonas oryziterrae DSM 21050 = YC6267]